MKILLINGHPDPESYTRALSHSYYHGALQAGHQVNLIELHQLKFDPNLRYGYRIPYDLEPDLVMAQGALQWCEHLVLFTPLWWSGMPALLKGFFDRIFLPGFAFRFFSQSPFWLGLLSGRSARVIYAQNSPKYLLDLYTRDAFWHSISAGLLGFCGFYPIKRTVISSIHDAESQRLENWLDKIYRLGLDGK